MEQSIGADHLSRRVAQDRELAVDNFLPDQTGVLTVIYTDCHNPRIQRIEVFFVPRELAFAVWAGSVSTPYLPTAGQARL